MCDITDIMSGMMIRANITDQLHKPETRASMSYLEFIKNSSIRLFKLLAYILTAVGTVRLALALKLTMERRNISPTQMMSILLVAMFVYSAIENYNDIYEVLKTF